MTTAQEVESTIDECNTAPVVNKYLRQYAEMIQKYADAVAENVRLREAMNKYSEELIERCAKVCEVMGFKHSECPEMSEYCADAIRALSPKRERREAKRRVSIEEYFGTGRRFLKDRRKA